MAVAKILKEHSKKREVSPEFIAINARISGSQLRRLLSGERPLTIDQFDLISAALGVSITSVLAEAEKNTEHRPRNPSTYTNSFKQHIHEKGF